MQINNSSLGIIKCNTCGANIFNNTANCLRCGAAVAVPQTPPSVASRYADDSVPTELVNSARPVPQPNYQYTRQPAPLPPQPPKKPSRIAFYLIAVVIGASLFGGIGYLLGAMLSAPTPTSVLPSVTVTILTSTVVSETPKPSISGVIATSVPTITLPITSPATTTNRPLTTQQTTTASTTPSSTTNAIATTRPSTTQQATTTIGVTTSTTSSGASSTTASTTSTAQLTTSTSVPTPTNTTAVAQTPTPTVKP